MEFRIGAARRFYRIVSSARIPKITANPMRPVLPILALLALTGCLAAPPAAEVQALADSVEAAHAPDRRVARFDVDAGLRSGGALVLRGTTTDERALAGLRRVLDARGIAYEDSVEVWPGASVGEARWAVAGNSVAHLRGDPRYSGELVTQVVLGTPLNVLEDGGWFVRVQTPEGYIGWVDSDTIERLDAGALLAYQRARKLIVTEATTWALDAPSAGAQRTGDLVAGSLLELTGASGSFYAVRYPDGREAYVARADAEPFAEWLAAQPGADDTGAFEPQLVSAAQQLRGVPYLWGGTSAKGVDCSGFTKSIYLLNGFLIPRDASQQVHAGAPVETPRGADGVVDFTALRPGDLLFFGRPATEERGERVVHVGMWIGDDQFIHSSGRVHVSSTDPASPDYDPGNLRRYLRTQRLLGEGAPGVTRLADDALFAHLRGMPTDTPVAL